MRWLALLFLSSQLLAAPAVYVRAGAGLERSRDTVLRDRNCASTQPPALFGCGFDARGDLGRGPAFELAIGTGTRTRVELALAHRELDIDATSNFTGVPGEQHVRADGRSITAMLNGAVDLAPGTWRLRPFITAGAGVASNSTGDVVYSFPGIAPEAVTITRGSTRTSFAWNAGAGAAFTLSDTVAVELTFRHADLGTLRSPRGTATIIRPNRTLELEIDETRAEVETRGIMLSLRWTR